MFKSPVTINIMARKTSRSVDFRLRSFTYRVSSNDSATQNQIPLVIDRFDDSKPTPHFFLNSQLKPHRRSSSRYQSNSYRKPKTLYFNMGQTKQQQDVLDPKAQTARTFQTFMNRETKDTLRGKWRIKFPLIQSSPEMSFMPFEIEYEPLQRELERCSSSSKDIGQQLSHLRGQLTALAERKSELDPFVESFMSKCQVLRKSLAQNRLRHLQCMVGIRQKIASMGSSMKSLQVSIDNFVQNTKDVQRSIFDTTFELQLEPDIVSEL